MDIKEKKLYAKDGERSYANVEIDKEALAAASSVDGINAFGKLMRARVMSTPPGVDWNVLPYHKPCRVKQMSELQKGEWLQSKQFRNMSAGQKRNWARRKEWEAQQHGISFIQRIKKLWFGLSR